MSSFLDRLKSRMTGSLNRPLFERPKPKEKSRHTIVTNRWDERVWQEARKSGSIDSLITDLSVGDAHRGGTRQPFEPAPELVHDVFMTFYKAAPQLERKRDIEREVYPVRKIVEEILKHPDMEDQQSFTSSDPAMSLIAVSAFGQTLKEIIGRVPPPPPPPQPKGQQGEGGGQKGEGDGEGDGEGQPQGKPSDSEGNGKGKGQPTEPKDGDPEDEDEGDGPGEGGPEEFDPDSEDAENQEEADWQAAYDDLLDDLDLERAVRKGMDAANDEVEELDNARRGIGLEDGEWRQMSPEERLKMAARLSTPEMKALAEAIGRMKRFALGVKATRVNDVPHEAYDVETGNDLRRLLRSEYALLATHETSYEFYRKYAEKELLQFKMRGHEEVGKGPIVIAIDKSGSMSGQPFTWAMGVAEALRRFAAEEDRDYYAMFFGSNNDRNRFDFPKGKGPFEKVLSFLSVAANGGTQFDGVLTEALEKATKAFDDGGQSKADIVFITDGQAHLDDNWIKQFNEERARTGVRVYSVYIGGAYDMSYHNGPVSLLEKISDAVIPVKDLRPESASLIFQKV